jgi:sigma-B regulation protein RsbU (phosphoserine phosphatase)
MSEVMTRPGSGTDADRQTRQIADLRAVLEVSRELAATTELTPMLQKIERAALKVLACERATVFIYDRAKGELYSRLATGVDEIRFPADRGIAGEVVRSGEVIEVPDAYADPRFNPEIDRQTGFRTQNMITFPLKGFDNSIIGVLQLLNKNLAASDSWDGELVKTFGAQVGVAVQRQLLLEHYAEKQRIERDLDIARDIQQGLLPHKPAEMTGFDIAGWNKPADQTGGDCYDYLQLSDDLMAITIADATGHGIGPALMIAECRALFRATISTKHDNLTEVIERVNNLLCEDLPDDRFVTAFFGLLSAQESTLTFLSAGHGPLVQYHRATDSFSELKANGVPLGIMPDVPFPPPESFVMQSGDMMILVTDGFFEWANMQREQFGLERMCDIIREIRDEPAAKIIQTIYDSVISFGGAVAQADDLTAVIIKKL